MAIITTSISGDGYGHRFWKNHRTPILEKPPDVDLGKTSGRRFWKKHRTSILEKQQELWPKCKLKPSNVRSSKVGKHRKQLRISFLREKLSYHSSVLLSNKRQRHDRHLLCPLLFMKFHGVHAICTQQHETHNHTGSHSVQQRETHKHTGSCTVQTYKEQLNNLQCNCLSHVAV